MPTYRRAHVEGGTYFFTVVAGGRARILCDPRLRAALRSAFQACRSRWPFKVEAIVLLPDHLHTIWTLPPEDAEFSKRWGFIKKEAAKSWLAAGGSELAISRSHQKARRRGVFQRRFWEHTIRGDEDFRAFMDYIHYNPVKHGLVSAPSEWPFSTFHTFVSRGVYAGDWGSNPEGAKGLGTLEEAVGE